MQQLTQTRPWRPIDHLDDDELAQAVAYHGAPAFEVLYERLASRVYGFCCSMLRDPGEAEDVLQETMARAYDSLSRPRARMHVKPWLFAIARNACIDRARQHQPQLSDDGSVEDLLNEVPSAQDSAEDRDRLRTLIADLASLSEAQRTALALREMSGLAHEEIANALGTTPARTKSLISEARRGLAERAVGREMPCEELRHTVADQGGRALRGRAVRAHMEGCEACESFAESTRETRSLALLMPVFPAAKAQSLLAGSLGSGGVGGGGVGSVLSALGAKQVAAIVAVAATLGGGIAITGGPDTQSRGQAGTAGSSMVGAVTGGDAGAMEAARAVPAAGPAEAKTPRPGRSPGGSTPAASRPATIVNGGPEAGAPGGSGGDPSGDSVEELMDTAGGLRGGLGELVRTPGSGTLDGGDFAKPGAEDIEVPSDLSSPSPPEASDVQLPGEIEAEPPDVTARTGVADEQLRVE